MSLNKVSAFTLVELVVAMLLTSILASLAYFLLVFLYVMQRETERLNASVMEVSNFERVLHRDFRISDNIKLEGLAAITCQGDSFAIRYEFWEGFVVRTRQTENFAIPDTFQINWREFRVEMENGEITEFGHYIDVCTFQVALSGNTFPIRVEREYSMEERMLLEGKLK